MLGIREKARHVEQHTPPHIVHTPTPSRRCTATQRRTSFEVPAALVKVAAWDIEVTVTSYGSHAPIGQPQHATPGTW